MGERALQGGRTPAGHPTPGDAMPDGDKIAGALGILTETGEAAVAVLAQLGIDVAATNADGTGAVPMPTVVIVDAAGVIRWADVHPDYGTRTEPTEILKHVAELA